MVWCLTWAQSLILIEIASAIGLTFFGTDAVLRLLPLPTQHRLNSIVIADSTDRGPVETCATYLGELFCIEEDR